LPGFQEIQPNRDACGGKDSVAQNLDCGNQFHILPEVYKQPANRQIVRQIQKRVVPNEG
jgi:hypothetical protein